MPVHLLVSSRKRLIPLCKTRQPAASSWPLRHPIAAASSLAASTNSKSGRPDVDESNEAGLEPAALATALARRKAEAVSAIARDALIIGADQLAVLEDRVLGKPGTPHKASRTTAGGRRQARPLPHGGLHAGPGIP